MNRMVKAAAVAALMLPALSQADDLSYNFLDVGYVRADLNTPSIVGEGIAVHASWALAPNWHVFGGVNQIFYGNSLDGTQYSVGLGYNRTVFSGWDFVGQAAWEKTNDAGLKEDGYSLNALMRGHLSPKFQFDGGIKYVDFGSNFDGTYLSLAGRYVFNKTFSLGASTLRSDGDNNYYGINFRFNLK